MLNSTLTCALRTVAEFGSVCYSSSCSVWESQQYCLVLFLPLIFAICEKEPFGWIWGWVLWLFWVTIAVTFVSEIFSSMPPMDICLKLNHVRSLCSLCCCLFYFSLTLHKIDYIHITHTQREGERERGHQKSINITTMIKFWPLSQSTTPTADHIQIHISVKLDVCFITFLWKT